MKTMIREMRSRPHRVVHNASFSSLPPQPDEPSSMKLSSWANMPEELLREVLIKIESSDTTWPNRKNVIACAGVCRSWRRITKEIVPCLEACGIVTFPISIKQPGPRESLVQCFIKRNRTAQTYQLYLNVTNSLVEGGKFLLSARRYRRTTCTDYIISLKPDDMSNGGNTYVGKLRSNFLGTKFTVFDGLPPLAGAKLTKMHSTTQMDLRQVSPRVPVGKYPVAHISYELNVMGSRGPRKMYCVMDAISNSAIKPGGVAPTQTDFPLSSVDALPSIPFFRSRSSHTENFHSRDLPIRKDGVLVLRNKSPRWHEQLQCWCLNFHGRVTVASVKNFQLVASPESGQAGQEHEKIILQFGKVEKDLFTMDYRYPISAFQAFAICLSSFDTKIACE